MRRTVVALAVSALVLAVAGGAAGPRRDHAATALNVLPPGQAGDVASAPTRPTRSRSTTA